MNELMTRHTDFVVRNLFDMGPDYARTLAHWRQRFVHAWQEIEKLGFDERFRRMWLYYFGYCEAGFNARTISVVQLTAERMRRYLQVFLLAVAFDLYWALVVLFREQGLIIWLALAILACLLLPSVYRFYAIGLAAAGSLLDTLWALTGLIAFTGDALMPLWMVALWLMFATVWTQLTRTTTYPAGCSPCWPPGGPVAYLIGERLGAITFLEPTFIVVSWMAPGWLVLMLFFHLLMGRQK
jgi:hypothetical protein